jgi:hypothetical protein
MESRSRFSIVVADARLVRQGWVTNPVSMTVTERWHGLGSGEIEVAADDPIVPDLIRPGARVIIDYYPDASGIAYPGAGVSSAFTTTLSIFSGVVRSYTGPFTNQGTITFQIQEDWRWLRNTRARVVPSNNAVDGHEKATSLSDLAQTVPVAGETQTAGTIAGLAGRWPWPATPTTYPAETAINDFLNAHLVERYRRDLGPWAPTALVPIDYRFYVPTDLGRGGNVRPILPQVRYNSLEDVVLPLLEQSSLGFRFVTQGAFASGSTIVPGRNTWEFWTPVVHPGTYTPDSGAVVGGSWKITPNSATTAFVGGPGEEAARAFRRYDDLTSVAADTQDIIDTFRDATGAPTYWPDALPTAQRVEMYYHLIASVPSDRRATFEAFLINAGADALADLAASTSVSLELQESEGFRYWGRRSIDTGIGFWTGDLMTVAPSAALGALGLSFTQRITETTFTLTKDEGILVRPHLGAVEDNPDRVLAATVRNVILANNRKSTNQ